MTPMHFFSPDRRPVRAARIALAVLLAAVWLTACRPSADLPAPAETGGASAGFDAVLTGALRALCFNEAVSSEVILPGDAAATERQMTGRLESLRRADRLCRTLMTRVDWSAEAVPAGTAVRLTPVWADHVVRPVLEVRTPAGAVAALADAWERQIGRATVWASGFSLDEDGWFDVLSTAELNCDALPYEAVDLLLANLGADAGEQVLAVRLAFPDGAADVPERQRVLADQAGAASGLSGRSAVPADGGESACRQRYTDLAVRCAALTDYDQVLALQTRSGQVTAETARSRTAYGALVDGLTICNGYARLYKGLCDAANLPCRVVFGTKDGVPHSWNAVPEGDDIRFVDCTCMDLDPGGGYDRMTAADIRAKGYRLDEGCIWPLFDEAPDAA